jgi:hypothetical protein
MIILTDSVNSGVLYRVKEGGVILCTVKKNDRMFGHILRRNFLLKHFI